MSKHIKCTQQDKRLMMQEFDRIVQNGKFQDGKISFNYSLPSLDNKANFIIKSVAWAKMLTLVTFFDKEIQWHGVVEKINDNTFKLNDILVFPHEITSTTVVSNQEKYEEWLNNLDDDTFNHLRFHGHSHVNMGVTPSSVDMKYRENIMQTISPADENAYYIFIILNKKSEISAEIYDVSGNILYGTSDINFTILLDDEDTASDFVHAAKSLATEPVIIHNHNTTQETKKDKKKDNSYGYYNYRDYDNPCEGCKEFDCENCKIYKDFY